MVRSGDVLFLFCITIKEMPLLLFCSYINEDNYNFDCTPGIK